MLRIAIVDDEHEERTAISKIVNDFFKEKNTQIILNTFSGGEALLNDKTSYDVIFLDIQMGEGIDGIETAQKLRVDNKNAALFYVTSYRDYIQQSMTIHPFAFIVKPFSQKEICGNLEDYVEYAKLKIEKENSELYRISAIEGRIINLNINNILYFHYMENRTIDVITADSTYTIKEKLSNIYDTLEHSRFIMPNQSFIVNISGIKEIDSKNKKIVMQNDDLILISRRKYNNMLDSINHYLSMYKG